jgi:hypothetical protein
LSPPFWLNNLIVHLLPLIRDLIDAPLHPLRLHE